MSSRGSASPYASTRPSAERRPSPAACVVLRLGRSKPNPVGASHPPARRAPASSGRGHPRRFHEPSPCVAFLVGVSELTQVTATPQSRHGNPWFPALRGCADNRAAVFGRQRQRPPPTGLLRPLRCTRTRGVDVPGQWRGFLSGCGRSRGGRTETVELGRTAVRPSGACTSAMRQDHWAFDPSPPSGPLRVRSRPCDVSQGSGHRSGHSAVGDAFGGAALIIQQSRCLGHTLGTKMLSGRPELGGIRQGVVPRCSSAGSPPTPRGAQRQVAVKRQRPLRCTTLMPTRLRRKGRKISRTEPSQISQQRSQRSWMRPFVGMSETLHLSGSVVNRVCRVPNMTENELPPDAAPACHQSCWLGAGLWLIAPSTEWCTILPGASAGGLIGLWRLPRVHERPPVIQASRPEVDLLPLVDEHARHTLHRSEHPMKRPCDLNYGTDGASWLRSRHPVITANQPPPGAAAIRGVPPVLQAVERVERNKTDPEHDSDGGA
ncbi:hypothetical protein FQR65_LT20744 [Abscondita terminalis]|nr:hypothetical protein FQR65_LT20744 [Abscondita terminalis]